MTKKLVILLVAITSICLVAFVVWFQIRNTTQVPKTQTPQRETIIKGKVIHKSDVQTIPDYKVTQGSIVLLKPDAFQLLLNESRLIKYYKDEELWHFQGGTSNEIASKFISASSELNSKGEFKIYPEEGNYVLCLVNPTNKSPNEADIRFFGCAEITIQENEIKDLDIIFAFGGLRIQN